MIFAYGNGHYQLINQIEKCFEAALVNMYLKRERERERDLESLQTARQYCLLHAFHLKMTCGLLEHEDTVHRPGGSFRPLQLPALR